MIAQDDDAFSPSGRRRSRSRSSQLTTPPNRLLRPQHKVSILQEVT